MLLGFVAVLRTLGGSFDFSGVFLSFKKYYLLLQKVGESARATRPVVNSSRWGSSKPGGGTGLLEAHHVVAGRGQD
jgi:hypothetical protein